MMHTPVVGKTNSNDKSNWGLQIVLVNGRISINPKRLFGVYRDETR